MVRTLFSRQNKPKPANSKQTASTSEPEPGPAEGPAGGPAEGSASASEVAPGSDAGLATSSEAGGDRDPLSREEFTEKVEQWRTELVTEVKNESAGAVQPVLDLTSAHPGGIAALYADSQVRLSNLVRQEDALIEAQLGLQAVGEQAAMLRQKHGGATMHLVVGFASWGGTHPANNIPVLMRRIQVEEDAAGNRTGDAKLQLLPGVEISSRLLAELERSNAPVKVSELTASLQGPHGYSPGRALELIAEAGKVLPDFRLSSDASVGIFTHPAAKLYRGYQNVDLFAQSPVLAAVAGDGPSRNALAAAPVPPRNPHDRDPWNEPGIGDQSPEMLDVVEAVVSGVSLSAQASSAADVPQAIASFAAGLAETGKRVLIVLDDPQLREDLDAVFAEHDLDGIVANFWGTPQSERVVTQKLRAALADMAPRGDADGREALRTRLRRGREALTSYTVALHEDFPQWGVSAYDALQTLTELTSLSDGPATSVRFDGDTLARVAADGAQQTLDLLERGYELGMFTPRVAVSPWNGVVVETAEEVDKILFALRVLTEELLPAVRLQMKAAATQTGLAKAATLGQWQQQLELFVDARKVLDVFRPEVFERPLADLAVATASPEWRKQKSINLKGSKRRQLVKLARDLVRPGVHVRDLHAALLEAQSCNQRWKKASDGEVWPTVPDRLRVFEETFVKLLQELAVVQPYLEPVYGDLLAIPTEELAEIMQAAFSDSENAALVPQRLSVRRGLYGLGLEEFVADMAQRSVSRDMLGLELDLAWWASALGLMLAAEPRLGGFDPAALQNLLAQTKALDQRHVESLGLEVFDRVQSRRREALALYPEQYDHLIAALNAEEPPAALFGRYLLAWDMLPIVIAGPALVPELAPADRNVDTLIVSGLDDLPFGEVAPVLARGNQVVVVNGPAGPLADTWVQQLQELLPQMQIPAEPRPANGRLMAALAEYMGDVPGQQMPAPRLVGDLRLFQVEGSGTPAPGQVGIESSSQEVEAVVDLVVDSLTQEPGVPVGVITLSGRHKSRVDSALRRRASENEDVGALIDQAGGVDQLLFDADGLEGDLPQKVFLSVGYAKTPHGRLIHDFGVLSTDRGVEVVRDLGRSVSGDLIVVTSLKSSDFDPARLRYPGEHALADLLAAAEELSANSAAAVLDWSTTGDAPDDLLVDLAERLHRLGLQVIPNLGTEDGMRIPLAIGHPEVPGELLVAILTDDEQYRQEPSLRVRDRHQVRRLEQQGWKVRTELSMAVFIDPNHEAHEIVRLVLDAVDEYYERMGLPHTPAAAAALARKEGLPLPAGLQARMEDEAEAERDSRLDPPVGDGQVEATLDEDPLSGDGEVPIDLGADVVGLSDGAADTGQFTIQTPTVAPPISKGLPLAAYSDAQLDELSLWLYATGTHEGEDEHIEAIRNVLGLTRRGAQSDAILRNVARRTAPEVVAQLEDLDRSLDLHVDENSHLVPGDRPTTPTDSGGGSDKDEGADEDPITGAPQSNS